MHKTKNIKKEVLNNVKRKEQIRKGETPSVKRSIWSNGSSMLTTTSNIQPPGIESGRASKHLGRELLGNSQMPLFSFPTCLPALVISPYINCTLSWKKIYRLKVINFHFIEPTWISGRIGPNFQGKSINSREKNKRLLLRCSANLGLCAGRWLEYPYLPNCPLESFNRIRFIVCSPVMIPNWIEPLDWMVKLFSLTVGRR